jgi:hypothetical protein
MAYTDINSEDRLVQKTFAEHLRNLRLDFALGVLGASADTQYDGFYANSAGQAGLNGLDKFS